MYMPDAHRIQKRVLDRSPGTRVRDGVRHHVGARNQTVVFLITEPSYRLKDFVCF